MENWDGDEVFTADCLVLSWEREQPDPSRVSTEIRQNTIKFMVRPRLKRRDSSMAFSMKRAFFDPYPVCLRQSAASL